MENNQTSDKELIHRLNRAQGQIEAIKKHLSEGQMKNCVETMQLLKAAQNALKKFGEAYVSRHLDECMASGVKTEDMSEEMKKVISSAFSM